jgi:hypothetical protein
MRVEVIRVSQAWQLRILDSSGQLFRVWSMARLIDVLELANALHLRIDNELPLNQFRLVNEVQAVNRPIEQFRKCG